MAAVQAVLQRCNPSLMEPGGNPEPDGAEAAGVVVFLTDRRRIQKVLWRQLFALDSMMSLLEGLQSAQQLLTESCPPHPEGGARARWKALKVERMSMVEETETLLRSLQDKIQQIHKRRDKLTNLVQHLHSKKQHHQKLERSLHQAQMSLRSYNGQLAQLRVEAGTVLGQLIGWERFRNEQLLLITENIIHVRLLAISQSELIVELRPWFSSDPTSYELKSLKLSVNLSDDERFTLEVKEVPAVLLEDWMKGRRVELSCDLQEVLKCYVAQAWLLSEIQVLRSSFAIDWRSDQRLLVYLKTASLVCHLQVEEGYPSVGRVRLLSVRRDGKHVNMSGLKPPPSVLSLTSWLVFLCSSPLI
ncbi:uncharacterized protein [Brachyistius frenatus]|uniref:uncharacterized protein n=1 Tax=Brachyistius frenatus TaxID=100188 RepID=UPI0037E8238F